MIYELPPLEIIKTLSLARNVFSILMACYSKNGRIDPETNEFIETPGCLLSVQILDLLIEFLRCDENGNLISEDAVLHQIIRPMLDDPHLINVVRRENITFLPKLKPIMQDLLNEYNRAGMRAHRQFNEYIRQWGEEGGMENGYQVAILRELGNQLFAGLHLRNQEEEEEEEEADDELNDEKALPNKQENNDNAKDDQDDQ